MKKQILLIMALAMGFILNAQQGSITPQILQKIQNSVKLTQSEKIMQNALSNNSISKIALNTTVGQKEDHNFRYEIETSGITNQKKSGRCWLFASLNIFRPKVMEKLNLKEFEFSESYLYFWHLFEKSNLFLENIIATADKDIYSREVYTLLSSPIDDGGAWNDFVNLVKKYGVVPKNVMPENYQTENTSNLLSILKQLLRKDALILREMIANGKSLDEVENKKIEMLTDIYRILVIAIGEPPKQFKWRYKDKDGNLSEYKTYTPQSFWNEVVGEDLDQYVMFVDDPTRPYYKLYERENERNTVEGLNWQYVNLPASEIKKYAIASLKDNQAMYFSCDVGKYFNRDAGTLDLNNYNYNDIFNVDLNMTKAQRMLTHQSGSTHGMALIGVDLDENGNPTKWKLENSWGSDNGHNGYLTMTDQWFDQYMFRIVIKKKYLDPKILKILKQKPEKVPYYNPAFSEDR